LKEGWIQKRGKSLKKWNKRYLVVRPDYVIDSFETEEEAHKLNGKQLTPINLSGYSIVEDPNLLSNRLQERTAYELGADVQDIPKKRGFPVLTFEAYHSNRKCSYFKAENPEEFRTWVAMFKKAAWRVKSLTWKDWCHERAFNIAVRRTRWEFGKWALWKFGGTEVEVISDLIAEELQHDLTRLWGTFHGPLVVKIQLRKGVLKTVDSMIVESVKPAWEHMKHCIMEERPKVEATLRSYLGPHFTKAKEFVFNKMKEAVMGILEPVLQQYVNPYLASFSSILHDPLAKVIKESLLLFDEVANKLANNPRNACFSDMECLMRPLEKLYPVLELYHAYDPSLASKGILPNFRPWEMLWVLQEYVHNLLDSAIYTWKKSIEEGSDPTSLKHDLIVKFKHDAKLMIWISYSNLMKEAILPPFVTRVQPAARGILESLVNLIPEHRQQFLDVSEMFEELYNGVFEDTLRGSFSALYQPAS